MLASKIVAPAKVEITEVEKPKLEKGAVLVKMQVGTICGSDLHLFERPRPPEDYPLAPGFSGHECVGIVEDSDSGEFQKGDRVLICPYPPIGFAQYVVLQPQYLVKLPSDGDLEKLVVGQQLGTVVYCCKKLPNVIDMDVAILGQGAGGLLFTAMLCNMGARKIIGIDIVADRLQVAKKMGATHVVDASKEDPVAAVKEITNGNMADLAVEAVGEPETVNQVVDLIRDRGYLVLFGIAPVGDIGFDYMKFFRKHPTAISSSRTENEKGYRSFKLAMDMIVQGRIDVTPMISHHIPLSQIDQAYDLALHKKDGAVKVLLDMQG
jgi:threonine dehydrogenase-like Zn-dependent dehydrogenase